MDTCNLPPTLLSPTIDPDRVGLHHSGERARLMRLPFGAIPMPMYDYKCLDCGKESLIALTLKDHEAKNVTCPHCASTRLEQIISSFMAKTTKKS
jgi:putative FmdB family regulatory protein